MSDQLEQRFLAMYIEAKMRQQDISQIKTAEDLDKKELIDIIKRFEV